MEQEPFRHETIGQVAMRIEDPWEPTRFIPLSGSLERKRFPPWLMVLFALVFGLIFFQVIGAIATVALLLIQGASLDDMLDFEGLLQNHAHSLLIGNTIGQVFALAIPIWLLVFLHTTRNLSFLRFRAPNLSALGLSVVGLAALMPISWWLGSINENLPLPEWLEQLEASQIDLIEQVFLQDLGLVFLLLTMAVTPAICEEIVFRGYIQRQLERSMGVIGGIVITGIIFGFFHLRLTQALPLAAIGIYLAYLTWRTGSIWPAIVVHFANNAFTICLGKYYASNVDLDIKSLETMEMPMPIVLACIAVLGAVIFVIHRISVSQLNTSRQADDPVPEGELSTS